MHSFFASAAGEFDLFEKKNGVTTWIWSNQSFGGSIAYVANVTAGDLLQTGFEPGDDVALDHQLLVLDPGLHGLAWTSSNGPSDTDVIVAPPTSTYLWVVLGALDQFDEHLWLFHNDAPNNDADGDGLGDNLEQAIGTCVSQSDTVGSPPQTCVTRRTHDSDLDGLSDYDELLGVDGTSQDLPLRRWGAHPLHKDVFAEVDWDSTVLVANPAWTLTTQWNNTGTPSFATRLRGGYDDGTAAELDNPDGVDGIAMHFDVKGSPWLTFGTNSGFFFDGGGSSSTVGTTTCDDFSARRLDSMNAARQPYFHYVCVTKSSGGQANTPGLSLRAVNNTNGTVVIHEMGHNLGLSHGGFEKFNGKPHYVSVMNYGFPGDRAILANNTTTWFSRNANAASVLNPESLCETNDLSAGTAALVDTSTPYFFRTNGGAVDWDRNGTFNTCTPIVTTRVTAPITWYTRRNTAAWNRTDAFATNATDLTATPSATFLATPALTAAPEGASDTRLYAFYAQSNPTLDYTYYRSGLFPTGQCAQPVTSLNNNCTPFVGEASTYLRGQAVAAATFTQNAQPSIFLAVRTLAGALKVYRSSGLGASLSFTQERVLAPSGAVGEPTMAVVDNALWVVWTATDPNGGAPLLMQARRLDPLTWSISIPIEVNSVPQTSTLSPTLARRGGSNLVYLRRARTVPKGGGTVEALQFLYRHPSSGLWYISSEFQLDTAHDVADLVPLASTQKPGLAWHASNLSTPEGPGGWLITTTLPRNPGTRTVMTYFDGHTEYAGPSIAGGDLVTGQFSVDVTLGGVTLLDDPALRHVQGAFIQDSGSKLRIMPYADGIFDYDLKDHDDYTYLKVGPCRSLVGDHCQPMVMPPHYPSTSTADDCSWGSP